MPMNVIHSFIFFVFVFKAEDESENIFQSLVNLRWNVYSALMRHHGEWKGQDLNEDLTNEIFLAISPRYCPVFLLVCDVSLIDLPASVGMQS